MRRTPLLLLALVATGLALAGCSTPAPAATQDARGSASPTPVPTASVDVPRTDASLTEVAASDPPARLSIDAIGVAVPVVGVGVDASGLMQIPDDPAVAGWYRFGAEPATGSGNVVISAHIDSPDYPIGPFAALRDVPAGAEVVVDSAGGVQSRWAVESVTYYPKAELPTDALFARAGAPALVLITCGGEFDQSTGHYRDNVVLVAKPAA